MRKKAQGKLKCKEQFLNVTNGIRMCEVLFRTNCNKIYGTFFYANKYYMTENKIYCSVLRNDKNFHSYMVFFGRFIAVESRGLPQPKTHQDAPDPDGLLLFWVWIL